MAVVVEFKINISGNSFLIKKWQQEVTAVDDDEYEILDGPASVPLYATVRTSGPDRKKKEIEETLKEDDYYEFIQQVREVRLRQRRWRRIGIPESESGHVYLLFDFVFRSICHFFVFVWSKTTWFFRLWASQINFKFFDNPLP
jgi:hypothetical protein